jgi:hypothetical protein
VEDDLVRRTEPRDIDAGLEAQARAHRWDGGPWSARWSSCPMRNTPAMLPGVSPRSAACRRSMPTTISGAPVCATIADVPGARDSAHDVGDLRGKRCEHSRSIALDADLDRGASERVVGLGHACARNVVGRSSWRSIQGGDRCVRRDWLPRAPCRAKKGGAIATDQINVPPSSPTAATVGRPPAGE